MQWKVNLWTGYNGDAYVTKVGRRGGGGVGFDAFI